jgi:hypothetical protein
MLIRIPIENMAGILKLFNQVGRNQEDKSTTLTAKKPNFLLCSSSERSRERLCVGL